MSTVFMLSNLRNFTVLSWLIRLVPGVLVVAILGTATAWQPSERLTVIHAPRAIPEIPKNLSGLTWNQETGTLFAVTNEPQYIFELSPEGTVLRRVALHDFKDTEGITHIEGPYFALVEERKGELCIVHLPANATELRRDEATSLSLGVAESKNKGFEGITYDPSSRTILTMREGKPFVCLSIPLDEQFRPGPVWRTPLPRLHVRDVASIIRDPDGTLWILSEASSRLVHLDHTGKELRRFALRVTGRSFQPEGVTRSPDGRIFIVGEPNILGTYKIPD